MSGDEQWAAAWEPATGPDPEPASRPPHPAVVPRASGPGVAVVGATSESVSPAAAALGSAQLLRPSQPPPTGGWRRVVYRASGRRVVPAPPAAQAAREALLARMRTPVRTCQHVSVVSLKGGAGKTTTAVCLGATFAAARTDQVIALDANPDRGSLADRLPRQGALTVRDLLGALPTIRTYADVRRYTSQGASRLESLASESDPAASQAFGEEDYLRCVGLLDRFYQVLITDSGTGLLHSAMSGVLGAAHHLVLVAPPSIDGARSADATLDWLEAHGRGQLARAAVTVIGAVLPGSGDVDQAALVRHFASRTRVVVQVPHDAHLEEGGEVDLAALRPATRDAYAELAAHVGAAFG